MELPDYRGPLKPSPEICLPVSTQIAQECYLCDLAFVPGDAVRVSKKLPEVVVFHDRCREPHRDYADVSWPPVIVEKRAKKKGGEPPRQETLL